MSEAWTIRLLRDRVLIRHDPEPETTDYGLFIPETGIPMELGIAAEVMGVGPGKKLEDDRVVPVDLKVGDRVYISRNKGFKMTIDNSDYRIVDEDEVLGVEA